MCPFQELRALIEYQTAFYLNELIVELRLTTAARYHVNSTSEIKSQMTFEQVVFHLANES